MILRFLMPVAAFGAGFAVVLALFGRGGPWHDDGPPDPAPPDAQADRVEVFKAERRMVLLRGGAQIREYRVALGPDPVGHKEREGDGRTPEGDYVLDWRNPRSAYHLSLHVSYPNEADKARAAAAGVDPGGMIMVHGQPNRALARFNGHPRRDWTIGCIAVSDAEMREVWSLVPDGTPIVIHP